jgi:hypothetical protein
MENIIFLEEIQLKEAIKKATDTLILARTMVIEGKDIPEELIPRLEQVIEELEQRLFDFIENDE